MYEASLYAEATFIKKHKQQRLTGSDKNHVRVRRKDTVINTEHFWIWKCSEQNKMNVLPRTLPSLSISTERKSLLWQWRIWQIYLADEYDRHEKLFFVEDLPLWFELGKVKKKYVHTREVVTVRRSVRKIYVRNHLTIPKE